MIRCRMKDEFHTTQLNKKKKIYQNGKNKNRIKYLHYRNDFIFSVMFVKKKSRKALILQV